LPCGVSEAACADLEFFVSLQKSETSGDGYAFGFSVDKIMHIGRLAPSPTGLLHLGNAWSFWLAWLDARSVGGRLVLRMEDIDPARSRDEYARAIRHDLAWLGLDWDDEARPQSRRAGAYEQALSFLAAKGLVYPCFCSRKELRSLAGAPQVGDAGAPYRGVCRRLSAEERAAREASGRRKALRLVCPSSRQWSFADRVCGAQTFTLEDCGGDFALCRSDGVYSYQLAVAVDDMELGVTSVVRGEDILCSTPRQLYLYSIFERPAPVYAHLPLVLDHQGVRLAKRHASLSLTGLREAGVRPEVIWGFLASLSGLRETFSPLRAADLLSGFSLEKLSRRTLRLPEEAAMRLLTLNG
jgi:glutamyl-tRNA synthetase